MPHFLVSGYLPDNFDPSTQTEETIEAIHELNREMIAAGVRKFAGGLGPARTLRAQPNGELLITDGLDLHVMGSADMVQTLFKNDLVDELALMIIPITLGTGKRLFTDGTIPASFKVTYSQVSPNGVIIVNYERDGDVETGAPQIEENDQ